MSKEILSGLVALLMVSTAGLIRGFSGFGFSIAAVPLLSLVFPPVQVVPVVMLLQFAVSLNGLRTAWRLADRPSLVWLGLGALIATPVGVWGLTHLPADPVRLIIAGIVALAVFVLARGTRMQHPPGNGATLAFGLASGLFNGIAGLPGPPVIAFYLGSHLPIARSRGSMIVMFLVTSVAALVPLIAAGMVGWISLAAAAIGLPAVWLSSWAGNRLFLRSPDAHYRRVALAILAATVVLATARVVLGRFA